MFKGTKSKTKHLLHQRPSLMEIINSLGLKTGLLFCLDAGDSASYTKGSQQWFDLSGNGNHFVMGTVAGQETSDPLFYGTTGRRSEEEYFTGPNDSNNCFFIPSPAVTYDDTWHKNNSDITLLNIFYLDNRNALDCTLMSNRSNNATDNAFDFLIDQTSGGSLDFVYDTDNTASSGTVTITTGNGTFTFNRITFGAVAFDEKATTCILKSGIRPAASQVATASANTTSPGNVLHLASFGTGAQGLLQGKRLYASIAWSSALTAVNLDNLFTELQRKRFPSMA